MLEHGGRLRAAEKRYGIPFCKWLDLSTGVNPVSWPVDPCVGDGWTALPEPGDGLEGAASRLYGAPHVLVTAGSVAAIRALPRLFAPSEVALLSPTFSEHAVAWRRAGHEVYAFDAASIDSASHQCATLVLSNPNNPTGHSFDRETLLGWRDRLTRRGGRLVVDEAFIDATSARSVASDAGEGLVVFRSLGKFYGLAGARVGFVMGERRLLDRLEDELGPWPVAGPSRRVAIGALKDRRWQVDTARRLAKDSVRLARLLVGHGLNPTGGSALFQWVVTGDAVCIHAELAQRAILVRLFDTPASLRFGLPGDNDGWRRLDETLGEVMA